MFFFTQWPASCKTQNTVNPLSGPQFQKTWTRLSAFHSFGSADKKNSAQNSHDIFQCSCKGGKWGFNRCVIEHHNTKTTRERWYTFKKFYRRK